jgi:hypothetical protein
MMMTRGERSGFGNSRHMFKATYTLGCRRVLLPTRRAKFSSSSLSPNRTLRAKVETDEDGIPVRVLRRNRIYASVFVPISHILETFAFGNFQARKL